jgi:hypothetical protein
MFFQGYLMTEFCPNCPLRGNCQKKIAHIQGATFEWPIGRDGIFFKPERFLVAIVECVDVDGGHSQLIPGVDLETVQGRIDECDWPQEKTIPAKHPILRPKTVMVCGTLGVGATVPPEIAEHYYRFFGSRFEAGDPGSEGY